MSIALENRRCIVVFRGQKYVLPSEFENFSDALRAGEEFCRNLGWVE